MTSRNFNIGDNRKVYMDAKMGSDDEEIMNKLLIKNFKN